MKVTFFLLKLVINWVSSDQPFYYSPCSPQNETCEERRKMYFETQDKPIIFSPISLSPSSASNNLL